MTAESIKYRSDIDGLRAISVMAVVLHHSSPNFVPGGYVGVDVFFVISGYLITTIIIREISDGSFSFAGFYDRRVRRIFPALFAVLGAVLILGYFILLPTDYLATFRGALGTSLFSANIVFWRDLQEGYFAADAKLNPLLHMWSLGVEEQFYLLSPILILLTTKCWKDWLLPILVFSALMSFLAAQYFIDQKSVAVFFLVPFRAWELLAGAVLAVATMPRLEARWAREALGVIGLLAIVVPIFAYDSKTTFPAITALPPVLGAVILIYVGSTGTKWVGSLLRLRPLVYIGLISYSLYLWHWPVIVFVRFWTELDPLTPWIPTILLTSVLTASASYHFIEQPFRKGNRGYRRRWVLGAGAVATVSVAAISLSGIMTNGFEARVAPTVVAFDQVRTAPIEFRSCESRLLDHPDGLCIIGNASQTPDVLLWGDSHMLAWLPGFEAALLQAGKSAYVAPNSACPPMLEIDNPADDACRTQNEAVFSILRSNLELSTVIISAFWSKYFEESTISILTIDGKSGNAVIAPQALRNTVTAAISLGKQVVLLGPVPTYSKDVPLVFAFREMMGRELPAPISLRQVQELNETFYAAVGSLESPLFEFVDVATWICRPACEIQENGTSLYRDSNHLSPAGARLFKIQLVEILASISKH